MLLHSCPDTVHRFLLRKTQTSTPLIEGSSTGYKPRIGITPAVADCRYRAPLSPRLHGSFITYFSTWSAHVCLLYPEKGHAVKRNLPCFHLMFPTAIFHPASSISFHPAMPSLPSTIDHRYSVHPCPADQLACGSPDSFFFSSLPARMGSGKAR